MDSSRGIRPDCSFGSGDGSVLAAPQPRFWGHPKSPSKSNPPGGIGSEDNWPAGAGLRLRGQVRMAQPPVAVLITPQFCLLLGDVSCAEKQLTTARDVSSWDEVIEPNQFFLSALLSGRSTGR